MVVEALREAGADVRGDLQPRDAPRRIEVGAKTGALPVGFDRGADGVPFDRAGMGGLDRKRVLAEATDAAQEYFRVPRVIKGEEE